MTNTEKEDDATKTRRISITLTKIVVFLIEIAMLIVFIVNLMFVLRNNFDIGTLAWGSAAFFFLIADSVRQGIGMALAVLPIRAEQGSDTPTREDA